MYSSPGNPHRHRLHPLVQHVHPRVPDRSPDRDRPHLSQLPRYRVATGERRALRRSIPVDDPRPRQDARTPSSRAPPTTPPPDQKLLHPPTAPPAPRPPPRCTKTPSATTSSLLSRSNTSPSSPAVGTRPGTAPAPLRAATLPRSRTSTHRTSPAPAAGTPRSATELRVLHPEQQPHHSPVPDLHPLRQPRRPRRVRHVRQVLRPYSTLNTRSPPPRPDPLPSPGPDTNHLRPVGQHARPASPASTATRPPQSSTMNSSRSCGYSGSRGTYTPPAFTIPKKPHHQLHRHAPAQIPTRVPDHHPTLPQVPRQTGSIVAPAPRSSAAPPNTTATASGRASRNLLEHLPDPSLSGYSLDVSVPLPQQPPTLPLPEQRQLRQTRPRLAPRPASTTPRSAPASARSSIRSNRSAVVLTAPASPGDVSVR